MYENGMSMETNSIVSCDVTFSHDMLCSRVNATRDESFYPGHEIFNIRSATITKPCHYWPLANVNVVTTCTQYDLKIFHTTMPFDGLCEYVCMVTSCITKKNVQYVFFQKTIKERELARAGGGGANQKTNRCPMKDRSNPPVSASSASAWSLKKTRGPWAPKKIRKQTRNKE